jgi:hypothetical protein
LEARRKNHGKILRYSSRISIRELPDRKSWATCLETGWLRKVVTGMYIWKQPFIISIGSSVHTADTPCSKVPDTNAWQHMPVCLSVCLFVCFPKDTPLRLRTQLLVPFNITFVPFELLAALFDPLTAAATLCSIITHSKPVNIFTEHTDFV